MKKISDGRWKKRSWLVPWKMLKWYWGVCISLHICLVLLDFGDDSLGLLGSLWLIRCLESGWCLGVFMCIIPSLKQELLKLGTFWGLHSRMGRLLVGLWGVCWPRYRFGSFFQPQRVMIGPQLWWQKFCMMQWRLVLRIQGLSASQQPVVQRLILEMTQLLLVAASAVDSSTVLSSSLQILGVCHVYAQYS